MNRLVVHPVVLSAGLPLFKETMDLKLLSIKPFPAGAVALSYARSKCDRNKRNPSPGGNLQRPTVDDGDCAIQSESHKSA
jgi:hypothetical protein